MKIRVSVIGASGYTGVELIRLLINHPKVTLQYLVSQQHDHIPLNRIYPHLANYSTLVLTQTSVEQVADNSDIVFLALPHSQSLSWVMQLLKFNCKIIDLSADFRLKSAELYQTWYQAPAAPQEILDSAIYGLPEIIGADRISQAKLIANPGCYPTATLLGLAPILCNNWLDLTQSLIVDAKSGVSGAGRGLSLNTHFCEVDNNFSAYSVGTHRHLPEISQQLQMLAGNAVKLQFTPHLIPIPRGLMTTIYCPLNANYHLKTLLAGFEEYYQNEKFINVQHHPEKVTLKSVIGSNFCHIHLHWDSKNHYLIVICCIDNLLKGAAGQAIQNMNILLKLPQDIGLQQLPLYP